jgi:hypothetical protein
MLPCCRRKGEAGAGRSAAYCVGPFPQPDNLECLPFVFKTAIAADLVKFDGTGRKADTFRYWLPSSEARWREDPLYEFLESLDKMACNPNFRPAPTPSPDDDAELPPDNTGLWPPGSPVE